MGGNSSTESGGNKPIDLQETFNKLDTNKSGTVDKNEVKGAMEAMGKPSNEIQAKLDAFGTRSEINFADFKTVMEGGKLSAAPAAAPTAAPAAAPATAPAAAPDPEAKAKAKPKSDGEAKAKAKPKSDGEPKAKAKGKSDGESKGKGKAKGEKGKGKGKDGKSGAPPSGPLGSGNGYRLNVKNLGDDVDEAKLKEMFAPFGEVLTCEIKKQDNGKSRGFGFVVFPTEEEGNKAVAAMNGKEENGKKLSVGPAERRETDEGDKGKGKGKGKDKAMAQQQYMAAAYMQQYQQYYYLQQLAYMQQQQAAQSAAGGDQSGREYEGSLKSISAKNGYGFIVCAETHAVWNRDVYVDKEILPADVKVADRLKFTVEANQKGHPRASSCYKAL